MTLPTNINLPIHSERIKAGGDELERYMNELIFSLQRMYEDMAQAVNGDIRTNDDIAQAQYLPQVFGASTAGVGTYNAGGHQVGWVLRRNLMVDVWFDLQWSAHTGTGNMYVELPYLVANSTQKPFVGVIQSSNITAAGIDYLVCNAIPDTRRCEIWSCVTAAPTANVTLDTAGQLIGHVRYIGQELERT